MTPKVQEADVKISAHANKIRCQASGESNHMHRRCVVWLLAWIWSPALIPSGIAGEIWQGALQGGGVIQVDSLTRKPTLYYGGGSIPLWDGVHQLQDGGVVIVRDGVAVPGENMYHTWALETPSQAPVEAPPCERLVRKVCGFHSECHEAKPCVMTLQLKRLQQNELGQAPDGQVAGADQECQTGLSDTRLFPPCDQIAEGKATPCNRLDGKVCGSKRQCHNTPACELTGQLLAMEREERLLSQDPHALTGSGQQCEEAMHNTFFTACRE